MFLASAFVTLGADRAPELKDAYGPRFYAAPHSRLLLRRRPGPGADEVRRWNEIAINASGLDHTPVPPGETRVFGEQFGPGRASRAMAIVHVAIFDAVNAILGGYESYTGLLVALAGASFEAAVAQAGARHARGALSVPGVHVRRPARGRLDAHPRCQSAQEAWRGRRQRAAAAAILALRAADHSQHAGAARRDRVHPEQRAGQWRQDPISQNPLALGAHWGEVTPFVMKSGSQFRVPPPPALDERRLRRRVRRGEADGRRRHRRRRPTARRNRARSASTGPTTARRACARRRASTTRSRCTSRTRSGSARSRLARLLALVNVAMADAGIAIWESKYFYQFWRPVTGIRESDPGTGPTGLGDGNPATVGDPDLRPARRAGQQPPRPELHAAVSRLSVRPRRLRRRAVRDPAQFYGTDAHRLHFRLGRVQRRDARQRRADVRPLVPRSFSTLSQAEEENGQSRIYLGIHWSFDKTEGIAQGRKVADWVFQHALARRGKN